MSTNSVSFEIINISSSKEGDKKHDKKNEGGEYDILFQQVPGGFKCEYTREFNILDVKNGGSPEGAVNEKIKVQYKSLMGAKINYVCQNFFKFPQKLDKNSMLTMDDKLSFHCINFKKITYYFIWNFDVWVPMSNYYDKISYCYQSLIQYLENIDRLLINSRIDLLNRKDENQITKDLENALNNCIFSTFLPNINK